MKKARALDVHPLATTFASLAEPELARLALDIKKHGLVNPVVLYEEKILDGRARIAACERAGVQPRFFDYEGNDPVEFVAQANAGRVMSPGVRAVTGARLARARKAQAKCQVTPGVSGDTPGEDASEWAARRMGLSRSTVCRTERLLDDEGLVDAVVSGRLRVNEALRRLPKKETQPAVEAKKKYWREPLAEKLRADLLALDARLREACADKMVRTLLEDDLAEFSRKVYGYSDGSAFTQEGAA